jgi:hypothetical protein
MAVVMVTEKVQISLQNCSCNNLKPINETWYMNRWQHVGYAFSFDFSMQLLWEQKLSKFRVASRLEKSGKSDIFSRSENCRGIVKIGQ